MKKKCPARGGRTPGPDPPDTAPTPARTECFERATNPTLSKAEVDRLLSFVVVGGGPTSCESTTELDDFLRQDVARWYPDLAPRIRVTLVEAGPNLLGNFDKVLVEYYTSRWAPAG